MSKKQGKPTVPPATAEDILGAGARQEPPEKWRRQHQRLVDLRAHFSKERSALLSEAAESTPTSGTHIADAATDNYDRDWALAMISADQSVLYEIEEAINRIFSGAYGVCEATGKPIPLERLNAIPWARFSVEAEKQLEKDGQIDRAKIGALDRVPRTTASDDIGKGQA